MGKQQSLDPIKSIYNDLGLQKAGVGYDSFENTFKTNADARKSVYNDLGLEKAGVDYDTFETKLGLKKKVYGEDSQSTSPSLPSGGITDLNSLPSGNSAVHTPLTPQGQQGYLVEQQVKQEKANQLSNKLNEYKSAYSNNRSASELNKLDEAKSISDKVSLESAIQPHKDQNGLVNFGKYNYNKLLQGTGSAINGLVDFGLQVANNTPAGLGAVNEGTIVDYRNNIAPKVKEGLKEYIGANLDKGQERKFDEGFVTGAVGGVLYSLPAMVSPYGIGLYSQAYDSGLESINRTEAGRNLTETQKTLYAGSLGAVMGRLEKLGLDKIMGGAGAKVANTILLDAFDSLAKKGVKKITQELLETELNQITKSLSKKLIRGAEGAVEAVAHGVKVEGTTGGLQELGTVGLERLTNYLTDEKVFDEESMGELAGRVLKSAGQEAIGGALMGGAIGGVKGFNEGVNTELVKRISNATSFDEQRNVLMDIEQIAQEQGMDEQAVSELVNRTNELIEINKTLPKELSSEERTAVIPIVEERNAVQEEIDKKKEEIKGVDEAFKKEEQAKIDLLEERKNKLNEFISDPTSQELEINKEQIKPQSNEKTNEQNVQDGEQQNGQENGFQTQNEGVKPEGKNDGQNEVQKEVGGQDAVKKGNIVENNQQQREGTTEQQQGQQEDRQYQEEPITSPKAEAGSSDSAIKSRQEQKVTINEGDKTSLPPNLEGGKERNFEFKDGEWKQKIGNDYTEISPKIQEQLNIKFNDEQGTTIKETKVEAQPIEKPTTTEKVGNAEDTKVVDSVNDVNKQSEKIEVKNGAVTFKGFKFKAEEVRDGLYIFNADFDNLIDSSKEVQQEYLVALKYLNDSENSYSKVKNSENKTDTKKPKSSYRFSDMKGGNQLGEVVKMKTFTDYIDSKIDAGIEFDNKTMSDYNKYKSVVENQSKTSINKAEPTKLQTAKEKLAEKRKVLKELDINLSVSSDPKQKAKALYEYHSALVDVAKEYINEGIKTVEDFAKELGEKVSKTIKDAWSEANGEIKLKESDFEERTTLRNKEVEEKRKVYGFDEPVARKGATDAELNDNAEKAISEGYDVYELIDKINNGKPITGIESVILAKFQGTKEAQLMEANQRIEESKDQSVTSFEKATAKRDEILDDLLKAYDASERSGTVASDALRARKVKVLQDYSLANMLIRYRKANGNNTLSNEQIAEVTKKYNDLIKAEEKLNKRIEDLETENEQLRTQQEINKAKAEARKERRATTKESIRAEREDIFKQLIKIANKGRSTLSANPIQPEMIPLIAKLVKNYVSEGVVDVSQIVDNIHMKLSEAIDGLTKRDVRDAISGYGFEEKKTKSDLQKDIEDLRKEAKLISQIEDAENGIKKVREENRPVANERLQALRDELKAYNRDEASLNASKTRIKSQIKELNERLVKGEYEKEPKNKVEYDEEAKRLRDAYRRIKHEFDVAVEKQKLANRTKFQKYRDLFVEIANIPRALMATADLSAVLRQGILPSVSNPRMASKAFVEMMKQWKSEERSERWLNDLEDSPAYTLMKESGLYIADKSNPNVKAREEDYQSNLAEKIPVLGEFIGASERAYTGYLNKMRVDLFTRGVDLLQDQGITYANNPKGYEALAKYINASTGRGSLGETLDRTAPILNTLFFSPRLMASRLQLLSNWANPKFYRETPAPIRKMYFQDMGKFLAFGVSVLALASVAGSDVEDDPRSPDFGKIRRGDTRWDIWGGFQQYVRILAQLASGEKKSTASGKITKLDGTSYSKDTRLTQGWNFIRGKFAPVPSFFYNMAQGQNTIGQPFDYKKEVLQMLSPLVIQGAIDSYKQDGLAFSIGATAIPSVLGVGVQTYGANNFLEKGVDDKTIKLLISKRAVAIEPHEGERKIPDINNPSEDRDMTDAEFKKYYDVWVNTIKEDLKENHNEYAKMSVDKFEKKFRSIKVKATKKAKETVLGFDPSLLRPTTRKIKGLDTEVMFTPKEAKEIETLSKNYVNTPKGRAKMNKINNGQDYRGKTQKEKKELFESASRTYAKEQILMRKLNLKESDLH